MRKDDHLIGMMNAGAIDLTVSVPGLRGRAYLTKNIQWSMRLCTLGPMFDGQFLVRREFLDDVVGLTLLGVMILSLPVAVRAPVHHHLLLPAQRGALLRGGVGALLSGSGADGHVPFGVIMYVTRMERKRSLTILPWLARPEKENTSAFRRRRLSPPRVKIAGRAIVRARGDAGSSNNPDCARMSTAS